MFAITRKNTKENPNTTRKSKFGNLVKESSHIRDVLRHAYFLSIFYI